MGSWGLTWGRGVLSFVLADFRDIVSSFDLLGGGSFTRHVLCTEYLRTLPSRHLAG